MKAHYNRISKAQYNAIYNEIRSQQEGITRRLMKLTCIALNESEGFGKKRCRRVMKEINRLAEEHFTDDIFWSHADRRIRQLGFTEEEFKSEDAIEMGEHPLFGKKG